MDRKQIAQQASQLKNKGDLLNLLNLIKKAEIEDMGFDILVNVPFDECAFDAAVSVESLHHFTKEEKILLYEKVRKALRPRGFFVLTDYFAASDEEERFHRAELLRLKNEQGIHDDAFYHYDTPLTIDHEKEALISAGFSSITVLGNWGPTYTLRADR